MNITTSIFEQPHRRQRHGRRWFVDHPMRGDSPRGEGVRGPRAEGGPRGEREPGGEREPRGERVSGGHRHGRTDQDGPWAGFGPEFAERGFGRGFGPGFGPSGPGGPGFGPGHRGHGRGPRRGRRGDVRGAILSLLADAPQNGYQAMATIAERSDGLWRPGPGSVYPALAGLQDEGLIAPDETVTGRRKVYALTTKGTAYVVEHAEELASAWEEATRPNQGYRSLRQEFGQVGMALQQVLATGSAAQIEAVERVLAEARRAIYGVLAQPDAPASTEDASRTGATPTASS